MDGKPLLMLHGWMDNCGTFDAIQAHLPKTYRCINIDLPGTHHRTSHTGNKRGGRPVVAATARLTTLIWFG